MKNENKLRNKKNSNHMTVKEMWDFCLFQAKGYRIIPVILVLGAVTGALVAYVNSFFYAKILDDLINQNYDSAINFVILLIVAVMVIQLIAHASNRIFDHYVAPSEEETRKRTARKAFSMEYEEIEKTETLQSFRRVRQGENGHGGIDRQLKTISLFFTECIKVVFAGIFVVVLMAKSDFTKEGILQFGLSTLTLLLAFIGVLVAAKMISEKIGKLNLEMNLQNEKTNARGAYVSGLMNTESYAQDFRLYNLGDYIMGKWRMITKVAEVFLNHGRNVGSLNGFVAFTLQLLGGVTYVYIVLKAIAGSVTTGEVLMYAGAIITMMASIRQLMSHHMQINYSNEYLRTYEEFINRPNMHYDGTLPIEKRSDLRYQLEFKNVSFKYPGTEKYILENLNIRFNIGEKIALVGRNGAGKTTLIKLLLRLYEPTEGAILLNGINIWKYDYEEYTKIFSVVFQDFKLYHFPLDENIAGSENVDEEKVKKVIEQVGLKERVDRMKDGIHTRLYHETGDGESLSGGEAQKVAIARAVYKDAPFVILDEPTAALDPIAEAAIYENFNELVGNKTALYISHRMSSCKFCDQVLVVDGGKIAEQGNHEKLLRLNGIYAELYNVQAKHYA